MVVHVYALFLSKKLLSFVSISQGIGWEGWVFCISQEIGWEDGLQNDLCMLNVSSRTLNPTNSSRTVKLLAVAADVSEWQMSDESSTCLQHVEYTALTAWRPARKPCCRNWETARCCSCSFRFKVRQRHSLCCKFKSSQASKARLKSSKHPGAKQNLTQNGDSKSFKVTGLELVERQYWR